jgi:hypothetical protein
MSDTDLAVAKRQLSDLRLRILKQRTIVFSLRREGGEKLEEATARLNSMLEQLTALEANWARLVNAS